MRAGRLRHRLVVEEAHVGSISADAGEETWVPRGTVWAAIEPIKGAESNVSNQILAEMDTKIIVRWSEFIDGVSAKWRLKHKTTIYNIVSIAHKNLGQREVEFMCKSGLNNG